MMQQGDVLLYQTNDDGDIIVDGGLVQMTGGLDTAVYLSLFGGNEQDDGIDANALQWWGNADVNDTAQRQRSETQYLLRSIPAVPANLRRINDAVERDLAWLKSSGVASIVEITVTIPALNRISITVDVDGFGFEYVENWKATT